MSTVRRFLFLCAVTGTLAACGAIVGVKETEVEVKPRDGGTGKVDAGELDEPIAIDAASNFENDAGPVVEQPVEAGCDATLLPPLKPGRVQKFEVFPQMDWVNFSAGSVGNADGNEAQCIAPGGTGKCHTVQFDEFGAKIPDNKQIVGLAVSIRAKSTTADYWKDELLKIGDTKGVVSGDHKNKDAFWDTTYELRQYGGIGTLWELRRETLTPAFVNQPNFTVAFTVHREKDNPARFDLDQISLSVWTCDPAP